MELEQYKKHKENIYNLYNQLYQTYILELNIKNTYKKIFDTISNIKYMKKNLLFNIKQIEDLEKELDFENITLSIEEQKELEKSRNTKLISFLNLKKEIQKFQLSEKIFRKINLNVFNINKYLILFIYTLLLMSLIVTYKNQIFSYTYYIYEKLINLI